MEFIEDVQPHVLCGPIIGDACCADRSILGLIAYSCGSSISIVDERTMQSVKTLTTPDKPESHVTSLRFLPVGLSGSTPLRLASGSKNGYISIWDIRGESPELTLSLEKQRDTQPIKELCWIYGRPWLLFALHGTSTAVIWDTKTQTSIWRLDSLTEPIISIFWDPRETSLAYLVGSKGHLSTISFSRSTNSNSSFNNAAPQISHSESKLPFPENLTALQVHPLEAHSNLLLVAMVHQLLVYDLQFGEIIATTPLPRGASPLTQILAPLDSPFLFSLHSDGSLFIWHRQSSKQQTYSLLHKEPLVPQFGPPSSSPSPKVLSILHSPPPLQRSPGDHFITAVTEDNKLWRWKVTLGDPVGDLPKLTAKLTLHSLLHGLPSVVSTLSPSPALSPALLAVASSAGSIHLLGTMGTVPGNSLSISGTLKVHRDGVRGLRWLGPNKLISFGYSATKLRDGTPGYLNSLFVTNVHSGQSFVFRNRSPDKSPVRGIRASPSGRYVLILFVDAPTEVWAMTRTPKMIRTLSLPFAVMEWALPPLPGSFLPLAVSSPKPEEQPEAGSPSLSPSPSSAARDRPEDLDGDPSSSESFAFSLANGSVGVFEVVKGRVRDFRPLWPDSSFVNMDVPVTAMAYRTPHVVMGDASGYLRWWDVSSGQSQVFQCHRGPLRRIRFCPVLSKPELTSRGQVALLFSDKSFAIFDLDTGKEVPDCIPGSDWKRLHVLEIDFLSLRGDHVAFPEASSQWLCMAVADGTVRLVPVHFQAPGLTPAALTSQQVPLGHPPASVALLREAQAMALKVLLQLGVTPSFFDPETNPGSLLTVQKDTVLRSPALETALEGLVQAVFSCRQTGTVLEIETAQEYFRVQGQGQGPTAGPRSSLVANYFGAVDEEKFWNALPALLEGQFLPSGLRSDGSLPAQSKLPASVEWRTSLSKEEDPFSPMKSRQAGAAEPQGKVKEQADKEGQFLVGVQPPWGALSLVTDLAESRIVWHGKLKDDAAVQKRVHEHVTVGDYEEAVTLLLACPPNSPHFLSSALRAVTLAAAVSPAMHELAVKVLAANIVQSEDPLSAIHLLCAVGCFQEACTQLQDAGLWLDAATLACTQLSGPPQSRVLLKWASHCLHVGQELWKAVSLFVAAGANAKAVKALMEARQPEAAVLFLIACHERLQRREEPTGGEDRLAGDGAESAAEPGSVGKAWSGMKLPEDLLADPDMLDEVFSQFEKLVKWLAVACTSPPGL